MTGSCKRPVAHRSRHRPATHLSPRHARRPSRSCPVADRREGRLPSGSAPARHRRKRRSRRRWRGPFLLHKQRKGPPPAATRGSLTSTIVRRRLRGSVAIAAPRGPRCPHPRRQRGPTVRPPEPRSSSARLGAFAVRSKTQEPEEVARCQGESRQRAATAPREERYPR